MTPLEQALTMSSFGVPHPGAPDHREVFVDWDLPRVCGFATNTPWPVAGENPVEVMRRCLAGVRANAAQPGPPILEHMMLALHDAIKEQRDTADLSTDGDGLWDFAGEAVFLTSEDSQVKFAAIGAVRVLRLRSDRLDLVFAGHTLAVNAAAAGQPLDTVATLENVVTRCLGVNDEPPEPQFERIECLPKDRFLLATVRTLSALSEGDIASAMSGDLKRATRRVGEAGCAAFKARDGRPTDGQAVIVEVTAGRLPTMRVVSSADDTRQ